MVALRERGAGEKVGHRWLAKVDEDEETRTGVSSFVGCRRMRWRSPRFPRRRKVVEDPKAVAEMTYEADELRVVAAREDETIDVGDVVIGEGAR